MFKNCCIYFNENNNQYARHKLNFHTEFFIYFAIFAWGYK
jgi:hypothetical protein